jgi:hypothetical protein
VLVAEAVSEHKTGQSSFDKEAYWERRNEEKAASVEAPAQRVGVYNRRMRRRKVVDRGATKKGMIGLVHIDENRQAGRVFAPKGSRPYNIAMHNRQRMQRAATRGE